VSERILVVEDDENMRFVIVEALTTKGFIVEEATSAEEAIDKTRALAADVVLMDVGLPGMDGIEAIDCVHQVDDIVPVIVITAQNAKEVALEAVAKGAYDFFTKPFKLGELEFVVRRALEKRRLQKELRALREQVQQRCQFENIIGQVGKMQEALRLVSKVAPTDATVLVIGETGTGKELIAEAIHQRSARRDGPLVKVNCAAIPEGLLESELFGHEKGAFTGAVDRRLGKFEQAHRGTIFLDEIGDMPLAAQAKVLRTLQDQSFARVGGEQSIKVDVRVIVATNKVLAELVRLGRFREDLFYRLNVFPIMLPPLRERGEDIPVLAEHFARAAARRTGVTCPRLTQEAARCLQQYGWPGNVRELENVMERTVIMGEGDLITPQSLPSYVTTTLPLAKVGQLDQIVASLETDLITRALRDCGWVQAKAARVLGISERSLWHRVKKYRIDIKKLQNA
jgi:two-component system response regulator AtoC